MPSAETHHDHAPTHTAARETDDVGCVWLRRTGFWATPRPPEESGHVTVTGCAQVNPIAWGRLP